MLHSLSHSHHGPKHITSLQKTALPFPAWAHHLVLRHGFHAKRASPEHPHNLLDEIPPREDYKSHNAAIRNHTANKRHSGAASTFKTMLGSSESPDVFALAAALKSSSAFANPGLGKSLHGFGEKTGFASAAAVEKAVMDMYARFNMLDDSCRVFDSMGVRDSVSWNILLSGFARAQLYGEAMCLFNAMQRCDEEESLPTSITIAVVLPVCSKLRLLKHGQGLHGYCIKRGLEAETLVGNALVSMYAKCGIAMADAWTSFDLIADKDIVSWNSLIAGFSENGFLSEAFWLFCRMVANGFMPNYATIASVLPICAYVDNGWFHGREIHSYVLKSELETDVSVCNALLTHYSNVGDMRAAESVFKNMRSRDVVTWNAVIAGYESNGLPSTAMGLFRDLISSGTSPDSVTLITILPVCAQLRDADEGRRIHGYVLQHSVLSRVPSVGNALITFYGKVGDLDTALGIFNSMRRKDLISWNAMLNGLCENGRPEKLAALFNQMLGEGLRADHITVTSVLQACALMGLRRVREAHGYSLRAGFAARQTVGNAVLDAYAKCGSTEGAVRAFESLAEKNVVACNTMISGFLKNGRPEDAVRVFDQMSERDLTTWNLMLQVHAHSDCHEQAFSLFQEMQGEGMRPDTVSIMGILAACARLASVGLVRQCHAYTIRASIDDMHLEGAVLDAYSKCGSMKDASKLFRSCPKKDLIIFTTMVGGFARGGMAEEAIVIFSDMLRLGIKPDHVILTTLLSACSHAGLVDEGLKHFRSIKDAHGIEPTMEHYACVVDLLSRRGRLKEAYDFINEMPCEPNANVWGTLLGACRTHGEVEIGRMAADRLLDAEGGDAGGFVVMSNIYAAGEKWEGVEEMRKLMKGKDIKKPAGCSWIEVESKRHVFVAGDLCHPRRSSVYEMLAILSQQIRVPQFQKHFCKIL